MASNPDGLRELYRDFLADARQCLSKLRAAYDAGDSDQFRQHAHYMKGSTQILGMRSLTAVCEDMEQAGKDKDLARVTAELDTAEQVLNQVESELVRRLGPEVVPKPDAAA